MSSAEKFLGHFIGGYQLKEILGKGGASVVFLGERMTSSQELVAVKVLLPPSYLSADELTECRRRFVREILTLGERLHHRSILPILASGEDPSTQCAYMVVPYISGGSLVKHLTNGNLSLSKISSYVTQIAEALDYAHSQQVIHRDLKPANILVDEEDHVYLADFGIAKLFDSALAPISEPGQAVGTPGYMAPEQARGAPVSSATDIYGLAILTYTLITKRLPFPSASMGQMLLQVATMPPIPPRTFRSDLPEPAEAVLLHALNKEPGDRFATACEFAAALAQGIEGQWPQGLSPQTAMSAQTGSIADSPFQISSPPSAESKTKLAPGNGRTSLLVSPLPESAPSSILHNDTLEVHASPLVRILNQTTPLPTSIKYGSGPVLVSRRMALAGLAGLTAVSGGILWYLFGAPSSPLASVGKQKAISVPSTSGSGQQPPMNSTPPPDTQHTGTKTDPFPSANNVGMELTPTVAPSPGSITPTPVSPLNVAITNIASSVTSGTTVPVEVTTNQPGASVTLHVVYNGLAQTYNSSPQPTDFGGLATFSWTIPNFKKHTTITATVGATASNTQGQTAQSSSVQVQIAPAAGGGPNGVN